MGTFNHSQAKTGISIGFGETLGAIIEFDEDSLLANEYKISGKGSIGGDWGQTEFSLNIYGEFNLDSISSYWNSSIHSLDIYAKEYGYIEYSLLKLKAKDTQKSPKLVEKQLLKGDDKIIGSDFNDKIDSQGGNDVVFGKNGNDFISGGPGKNKLYGGSGKDTFSLQNGKGHSLVMDFDPTEEDQIKIKGTAVKKLKGSDVWILQGSDLMGIIKGANKYMEYLGI